MKASNKLLIAVFIFMPLTMTVFNLLLKDQFVKGNISAIRPVKETNVKYELKPFRHVVFDGRLLFKRNGKERAVGAVQALNLSVKKGDAFMLEVPPGRADMLNYSYRGDTLFIKYEIKEQSGRSAWNGYARLTAPAVSSVTNVRSMVNIEGLQQDIPVEVRGYGEATFTAMAFHVPVAHLHLEGNSKLEMLSAEIDTLSYDLAVNSELALKRPYTINVFKPGVVDTLSIISVAGNGTEMQAIVPSKLSAPKKTEKMFNQK